MLKDLDVSIGRNPVVHVFSAHTNGVATEEIKLGRTFATSIKSETGHKALFVRSRRKNGYGEFDTVFLRTKAVPRCIVSPLNDSRHRWHEKIAASWSPSVPLSGSECKLRNAQRGALFATLAHWSRSSEPATVVMPTGTGKTETLLATIATLRPRATLVIVPTDPLRTQFYEKALTWGRLKDLQVLATEAEYPIVGMLRAGFKSIDAAKRFINQCHIIVATMPILTKLSTEAISYLAETCDLVAIDEAHHLGAPSWARVVDSFSTSRILQFTATPFRNDGKHIGGEIIYRFPLAKCQQDGFSRPIEFLPVIEYFDDKADILICDTAVERFRQDLGSGFNHAIMARTSSKERARRVFRLYEQRHGDLNPVMIYSGMGAAEKESAKRKLLDGVSKVVVCVDMLGEGFDFPPLKIAAIHDPHKSLPITLQFIGRFTRSGDGQIGDASVVANIADPKMCANVSSLYSQDADWDQIIQGSYENAVGHEVEFQRFINGFVFDGIAGFSLRNIRPKYSAFVYRISNTIDLELLKDEYNDGSVYRLALNTAENMAVIVQRDDRPVDWGNIDSLVNTNFDCYCLYHDDIHGLLFIYSSNGDVPDRIASTVAPGCERICDNRIHRCLHGINRLMLSNVGLRKRLIGPIRYRQYIGLDVGQGLRERITENTYTAMLFGSGYENAERANIGCSLKGKIWSRNGGELLEWSQWCNHVGAKLVNSEIAVETILDGVLFPEVVKKIPSGIALIAADWADFFFENMFERSVVKSGSTEYEMEDCELRQTTILDDRKSIRFLLCYPDASIEYELCLTDAVPEGYRIRCLNRNDCNVVVGREAMSGADFFSKHPPMFWFDDLSCLADGCLLVRSSQNQVGGMFDPSLIATRTWNGVDIRVESQGEDKRPESIQRFIIEELLSQDVLFVYDDDGSGEVADIVAAFVQENNLLVRLYHCKYSSEPISGCRVGDVYTVCGQAQKSVKWAGSADLMVQHLKRREITRLKNDRPSRFEYGDMSTLTAFSTMTRQKRIKWEVILVQPGLSKASLITNSGGANSIMRILGATASYLAETFDMKMKLIVSE